ncbi:34878_t:CDS:2, partial [Gigaspora margarita]
KENNELETKKIIKKCKRKILTEHWSTKDNNIAPDYVKIEKSNGSLISEQNSEYSWLGQSKVLIVISKPLLKTDNDQNFNINLANNLVNSLDCNISSGKNSFWIYTNGSLIHEGNKCSMGSGWAQIFETWNGTNWRLSESILALKPKVNNSMLDWYIYWKRIKKLKGIRCNTLQKNKKLAT